MSKKITNVKSEISELLMTMQDIKDRNSPTKEESGFKPGGKVKLDVERILSHPLLQRIKFRNFVKRNRDKVFTLEHTEGTLKESDRFFTFEELSDKGANCKWIFDTGDLIKVE